MYQGHHPSLQERVSRFTTALRNNDPPIPGLDDSIIIPPPRLHLTLGVVSLSAKSATSPQATDQHRLRRGCDEVKRSMRVSD
ncbi:hypothetical protein PILCRDRAFT_740364 [Piloderma croceum F 1598]|uniref:Uncharacterized protein n=1 Tax=Piloderma croceum (strain F 1598) TaxID=765440 RepID=A0A0C3EWU8_PILCF|nr:hypothetical protein PILCRDRAFT_740364 [Piloderma croceum F 1598]